MKKPKLNQAEVTSELADSLFFRQREPYPAPEEEGTVAQPPEQPAAEARQAAAARSPEHQTARTGERVNGRSIFRMSFEIYRDQHADIKKFSLEDQLKGEKGSMSEMVREALDAYIAKRKRQRL